MKLSWAERIKSWFSGHETAGAFNPAEFERLCLENPDSALAALRKDQRELTQELEKTYAAYSQHLCGLAARLSNLSKDEIAHEARLIRDSQDAIRRTFRRISVSIKTARDLERELKEWEQRKGEAGPLHADHPEIRAEIVRSELAARNRVIGLRVIEPGFSPFRVAEPAAAPVLESVADLESTQIEDATLPTHDHNDLIALIRQESREAERWHAIPVPAYEAIEQVRHVRSLHALLRRLDREAGIRRDRTKFVLKLS